MTAPAYIATPTDRDLTWLDPRDQQERCRALDRLDAALAGADGMAGHLGETTTNYAHLVGAIRNKARLKRQRLLPELEGGK